MSAPGSEPVPTKVSEVFVMDNWDYVVIASQLAANDFSGNNGVTESIAGATKLVELLRLHRAGGPSAVWWGRLRQRAPTDGVAIPRMKTNHRSWFPSVVLPRHPWVGRNTLWR
jgi:hypothetical protein